MRIYLWTALRIRDLRMMGLRINGFLKRDLWFLKEGFEEEIFLATDWDNLFGHREHRDEES